LDQFFTSSLKICGEVYAPASLAIFSSGNCLAAISDIYANPLSLALCRNWLNRNLPYARIHENSSLHMALDRVRDNPKTAVLGSRLAASLARLNILGADISDQERSQTRFLVLGQQSPPPSGADKTSILFNMTHHPGFLYEALGYLRNLNLTRIESRPALNDPWNYSLFVDMEGHVNDQPVADALAGLAVHAKGFKLLGSYPQGASEGG
jgi:chorismate mutase/prephenate dehydratase